MPQRTRRRRWWMKVRTLLLDELKFYVDKYLQIKVMSNE